MNNDNTAMKPSQSLFCYLKGESRLITLAVHESNIICVLLYHCYKKWLKGIGDQPTPCTFHGNHFHHHDNILHVPGAKFH